jgi:Raf kinase inhibitor-like YbhB/YbcL family protein
MSIQITSDAFAPGATIPTRYTGEGDDVSPPLKWSGVPDQAKELALIVDDPDAPQKEPFVHWVMYKIPANAKGLPEGVAPSAKTLSPPSALQGKSSFRKIGYGGPMPPRGHGTHHYHFKLYALDQPLTVRDGLDKTALLAAMSGHILDQGELVGTYERYGRLRGLGGVD